MGGSFILRETLPMDASISYSQRSGIFLSNDKSFGLSKPQLVSHQKRKEKFLIFIDRKSL